ncbi:MAG: hypothetical protein JNJ88_04755 [Planctomycetes bacterium]|nr:hypothetical protein [Planctomycetota bacterium]
MKGCHQCGTAWTQPGSPGFDAQCIKCSAPLHACKSCRHYDPSRAWNWCKSLSAEPPRDADGKNFCEEFDLATLVVTDEQKKRKSREAFDRLFKKLKD